MDPIETLKNNLVAEVSRAMDAMCNARGISDLLAVLDPNWDDIPREIRIAGNGVADLGRTVIARRNPEVEKMEKDLNNG